MPDDSELERRIRALEKEANIIRTPPPPPLLRPEQAEQLIRALEEHAKVIRGEE